MEKKTPFVNLKRRDPSVASNELYLTHIGLIHLSIVLAISQTTNNQVLNEVLHNMNKAQGECQIFSS